jgi:two-component system cell cycle sensor histidine kinase/response regulator CckA
MARTTLLSLGYKVLSAADGEEAIRLAQQGTPDLAILDMIMPNLGGPATARKLLQRFENLPILFTSGYAQENHGVAEVSGAEHYLQKPYSPSALARLVREVLDSKSVTTNV